MAEVVAVAGRAEMVAAIEKAEVAEVPVPMVVGHKFHRRPKVLVLVLGIGIRGTAVVDSDSGLILVDDLFEVFLVDYRRL